MDPGAASGCGAGDAAYSLRWLSLMHTCMVVMHCMLRCNSFFDVCIVSNAKTANLSLMASPTSDSRVPKSFRFKQETATRLEAMAEATGLTEIEVMDRALAGWLEEAARLAADRQGKVAGLLEGVAGSNAAQVRRILRGNHDLRKTVHPSPGD